MRSAQERMAVVTSIETVCSSARGSVDALRGSGRLLRSVSLGGIGILAAGGTVMMLKGLFRKKVVPVKMIAPKKDSMGRTLVLQGVTMVLFPLLREILSRRAAGASADVPLKAPRQQQSLLSRYSPSRLFFRWLGLDR